MLERIIQHHATTYTTKTQQHTPAQSSRPSHRRATHALRGRDDVSSTGSLPPAAILKRRSSERTAKVFSLCSDSIRQYRQDPRSPPAGVFARSRVVLPRGLARNDTRASPRPAPGSLFFDVVRIYAVHPVFLAVRLSFCPLLHLYQHEATMNASTSDAECVFINATRSVYKRFGTRSVYKQHTAAFINHQNSSRASRAGAPPCL